ncbi:MAG: hypothetical protein D6731_13065 [Planctomycetota bacterium]|nr:MAG: hypothetical protein D6731_13065 [Planctomycetota bacterium]
MSRRGLGPTAEEVEALLGYLGFTEEDAERIRRCGEFLGPSLQSIANRLYDHIQTVPRLAEVLDGHLQQCRIKQSAYLKQLLAARIDTTYAASRAWVGEIHRLMGVEPKWYMASYCKLERMLVEAIAEHEDAPQDPQELIAIVLSLRKLIAFDTAVANEAYERVLAENHRRREQALADSGRPMVLDVGEGISILALGGSLEVERTQEMHGAMLQAFAAGARVLVADLTRVTEVDADAAAAFFDLLRSMQPALRVLVAGFSPAIERSLVTRPDVARGVERCASLAEAVARGREQEVPEAESA